MKRVFVTGITERDGHYPPECLLNEHHGNADALTNGPPVKNGGSSSPEEVAKLIL